MIGGGEVPFTPDNPPHLTEDTLDPIIRGAPRKRGRGWSGGHGYGERGGPPWFPKDWDRDRIRDAVQRVIAGPPDLEIERLGRGSTLLFRATIDGLRIEVRVRGRHGPPQLWTAYPHEELESGHD